MKILAFGDIHFHHTHRFSTLTPTGFTTREIEHMNCANDIIREAKENNVDEIVCLGDLWGPTGDTVSGQTLVALHRFLTRLSTLNIPITIIMGNHDVCGNINDEYFHKLEAFKSIPNITILDQPTRVGNFMFMPYNNSDEKSSLTLDAILDKENVVIFSHLEVQGINLGLDIFSEKGVNLDLLKQFKCVIMGHYHSGGKVAKNVYLCGSSQRLSFKDRGASRKNIIIYDTESNKVTRKSFSAPDWLTFTDNDVESILDLDENNYVRLELSSDIYLTDEIKSKLEEFKGKDVSIDVMRIKVGNIETQKENTDEKDEIELIKEVINNSDKSDEFKKKLLEEGIRLINNAKDKEKLNERKK